MQNKKVFVAGCGGLGCYDVEFLARLGAGSVTVADGDVFTEGNMNRQLYCVPETLGRNKAEAAAARWPGKVRAVPCFVSVENAQELLEGCDIVIDALDSAKARKMLAAECEKAGIPMIHGAIGGKTSQCCVIFPGDRDILDILYPEDCGKNETVSYVPALCASLQTALAAKILNGEDVPERTLYITDLETMDFGTVKL